MADPVNPNQQNINPQKAKNPQNRDHEQHNQAANQKNSVQQEQAKSPIQQDRNQNRE